MKFLCFCFFLFIFTGCQNKERKSLDGLQKKFIHTIFSSQVEESPFLFDYSLKTVFFSDEIVSLFGEFNEHTNIPHGHGYYEGKTYYKNELGWKELTLNNLFVGNEGKEFLRTYCENDLKQQQISYFSDPTFSHKVLNLSDIQTFVINQHFLIVVFQPYVAGSYADGPFIVKVPFEILKRKWKNSHPFCKVLDKVIASKNYVSSWDIQDFEDSVELLDNSAMISSSQ